MAELRIISQPLNEHAWFTTISGRMDAANFNVMEDEFNRLLESGAKAVAIEVSELEDISSSGLGALIDMNAVLRDRGGKLVVSAPSDGLAGLISMLGVHDAVQIVATRDEANRELAAV